MTDSIADKKEFSEKTVDKAIEAACAHFGCKKDELEIEIITRGSTGLFGLGGRKAKIKARPAEQLPAHSHDEIGGEAEDTAVPKDRGRDISGAEISRQVFKKEKGKGHATKTEKRASKGADIPREELERHLAVAAALTNELLEKAGLSGRAHVVEQTSKPYINITGEDLSLIIGKDGHTLDALEFIVNLSLRRKNPDTNHKIVLEATGYRDRKKKSLVSLAERMAQKAKKTGRAVSLQPMPAKERRIIHIALRDFRGVRTHSAGEGSRRKVVITPFRRGRRHKKTGNQQ